MQCIHNSSELSFILSMYAPIAFLRKFDAEIIILSLADFIQSRYFVVCFCKSDFFGSFGRKERKH